MLARKLCTFVGVSGGPYTNRTHLGGIQGNVPAGAQYLLAYPVAYGQSVPVADALAIRGYLPRATVSRDYP